MEIVAVGFHFTVLVRGFFPDWFQENDRMQSLKRNREMKEKIRNNIFIEKKIGYISVEFVILTTT